MYVIKVIWLLIVVLKLKTSTQYITTLQTGKNSLTKPLANLDEMWFKKKKNHQIELQHFFFKPQQIKCNSMQDNFHPYNDWLLGKTNGRFSIRSRDSG